MISSGNRHRRVDFQLIQRLSQLSKGLPYVSCPWLANQKSRRSCGLLKRNTKSTSKTRHPMAKVCFCNHGTTLVTAATCGGTAHGFGSAAPYRDTAICQESRRGGSRRQMEPDEVTVGTTPERRMCATKAVPGVPWSFLTHGSTAACVRM